MFDTIQLVFELLVTALTWLMQVIVRLICVLLAVPFVFFMPRGRAYQDLTYMQTLIKRFKFLGRSLIDAFKGNPI